jgi:hypothetical protein
MSCECDEINVIENHSDINIVEKNNVIVVSHADGRDGRDGKSAYQQAVEGGYTGTEQEFNCSLSLLADVAEGKKQIADAINTKGGSASADSSFSQLAEDIVEIPYTGISSRGIVLEKPFSFLDYCCNADFADFTEIDDDTITGIMQYAFQYKNISKCKMTSVTTIGASAFSGCFFLQEIDFPSAESINKTAFQQCKNLIRINLPSLEIIENNAFQQCENIINHSYPQLHTLGASAFLNNDKCVSIEVGVVTTFNDVLGNNNKTLRNFKIGQGTDVNIQLQKWTATNVINEGKSGIDELNSNLRTNLLEKLADHSTDGQTRTLRLGWLAYVTQENIDYANSKGWTLTT